MALSTQTVVSDGSLVLLDISIEYLERSEIAVYFDSVPTTAWAWVGTTDKQITFSPAVPAGVVVLLRRTTDMSAIRHEFSLGAAFTAEYLDEALKQTLHIAQEGVEANFGGDFYADIDMHMNGVHNVADPVAAQDAATKNYVDTGVDSGVVAAAASAASASTSASNAATSASAASTAATNAASSASAAATSATNAAASATSAAGSATTATTQASNASTSATNAANSATAAAASYDSFDDRYLGPKASDPTLDNDGAALLTGALYFNTTTNEMRVRTPSATWVVAAAWPAGILYAANNLSDVANAATARSNLGAQAALGYTPVNKVGDTMTGGLTVPALTVTGTGPTVTLYDTDLAYGRYLHVNDYNIGFLTTGWGWAFRVDNDGNAIATGNVTAYSDVRLKKDFDVIPNALDKVQQLTGYTYTRIDSGARQTGLIAQDVQKVLPEAVDTSGEHMALAYGNLVGLLVEAIKEQQKQIDELKAKVL